MSISVLLSPFLLAAAIGAGTPVDLRGPWQFHPGDDLTALSEATIRADRTGRGRIRAAQPLRVTSAGKTSRATHPEPGITEFDTTAGSTYVLSPASTTR